MRRAAIFVVAFVALVTMSVTAHADNTSIGRLHVTIDYRAEVRFGDVQHYRLSVRPEQPSRNVYALWMLSDALTTIDVDSTLPCMAEDNWLLCYTPTLTDTATVDVMATVRGPAIADAYATVTVGDADGAVWVGAPTTLYRGGGGTVPMPDEWQMRRLYFADVRN